MKLILNKVIAFLSFAPIVTVVGMLIFQSHILNIGLDRTNTLNFIDKANQLSILITLLMVIFFIIYIYKSNSPSLKGKKALWISLLILGHIIAIPFFWYFQFSPRKNQ